MRKVPSNCRLGCRKEDEMREVGVACTQRCHDDGEGHLLSVGLIDMGRIRGMWIKTKSSYSDVVTLKAFGTKELS